VTRRLFWTAFWLAIALVAIKAYYLGVPADRALADAGNYLRSLAAISYVDVLFAVAVWVIGRVTLAAVGRGRLARRVVTLAFPAFSAFSCHYALPNGRAFAAFG